MDTQSLRSGQSPSRYTGSGLEASSARARNDTLLMFQSGRDADPHSPAQPRTEPLRSGMSPLQHRSSGPRHSGDSLPGRQPGKHGRHVHTHGNRRFVNSREISSRCRPIRFVVPWKFSCFNTSFIHASVKTNTVMLNLNKIILIFLFILFVLSVYVQ